MDPLFPGEPRELPPRRNPAHRFIGVERTVQALLDADEERFAEFAGVVADWGPGSEGRPPRQRRTFQTSDSPDD